MLRGGKFLGSSPLASALSTYIKPSTTSRMSTCRLCPPLGGRDERADIPAIPRPSGRSDSAACRGCRKSGFRVSTSVARESTPRTGISREPGPSSGFLHPRRPNSNHSKSLSTTLSEGGERHTRRRSRRRCRPTIRTSPPSPSASPSACTTARRPPERGPLATCSPATKLWPGAAIPPKSPAAPRSPRSAVPPEP